MIDEPRQFLSAKLRKPFELPFLTPCLRVIQAVFYIQEDRADHITLMSTLKLTKAAFLITVLTKGGTALSNLKTENQFNLQKMECPAWLM